MLYKAIIFKGTTLMPSLKCDGTSCRFDVQYRTYSDTNTLSIYFAKASPGVISFSEDVADGILVDYDTDEKIVSFDLFSAPDRMACHFFDTSDTVDGKPPLTITWDYDPIHDILKMFFHANIPEMSAIIQATEDAHIVLGMSTKGEWQSISFLEASKSIRTPE